MEKNFRYSIHTKLQSFQYRIIHKIIPCNKWLHTIKIKIDNICNFCTEVDDMTHFFINCPKVKEFWSFWLNWWEKSMVFQLNIVLQYLWICLAHYLSALRGTFSVPVLSVRKNPVAPA